MGFFDRGARLRILIACGLATTIVVPAGAQRARPLTELENHTLDSFPDRH